MQVKRLTPVSLFHDKNLEAQHPADLRPVAIDRQHIPFERDRRKWQAVFTIDHAFQGNKVGVLHAIVTPAMIVPGKIGANLITAQ